MPKVSVVVPVYNAERYLNKCIESLINQTLRDLEIVLVNDGSTDGSLKIVNEYAKKDSRIVVLDKENEGAGVARRKGVEIASAPYVCFLDSDDYVEDNYALTLLTAMEKRGVDLVECAYRVFDGKHTKIHSLFTDVYFDSSEFKSKVIEGTIINGTEAVVMWNKLYKKELFLRSVKRSFGNLLEDYAINMQYYSKVNSYAYVSTPLVNYRVVRGSLSRKFNPLLYKEFKEIVKFKLAFMEENGFTTDENYTENARWILSYTENYLISGLGKDGFNAVCEDILKDGFLVENAKRLKGNSFADKVVAKDISSAIKYLKTKNRKLKIKRFLYSIKRKFLR
ncbi:MAG: glycosyltransferase [Clostridia bacterium]|nr:glycosyltransferase [Clostridia bacterium]